ncbi:MAG: cyclomaltodextrinase N-terminal domain-containing protein [Chitinophagaceae bacterium]|nr:cyclomaltodextrinase N-terminal domain-containing protein [Chitinophagaceae bacterium]
MQKKIFSTLFLLSVSLFVIAQQSAYKCYPANWWAGMKWNKVQLMLHADSGFIFPDKYSLSINFPGIKVEKINRVENKRYLFVDISIAANTKPGIAYINVNTIVKGKGFKIPFEIKQRRKGNGREFAQGVTAKDFIYLILPDRFSNGDPSNDRIPGMRDQTLNRDTVFNRHGGDIKGVEDHLDYIQDLGVTTLWLNPVIENDRPERTEHGYAFTDHYTIDRRLGGEKAYQSLIDATHKKGMKMIQDAVYNHVDSNHITILDMPMEDWVHNWNSYTNTTYKDQVAFDPYASVIDKKKLVDGWFTKQMPDLNQHNPYVANYLIQHAIWTVEEFGIDGWRIDTYAYNDLGFMNRCNKALTDEYPKLTLFGETWFHGVPNQAYMVENNINIPFKSNLQGATDFQTLWGIQEAMTHDFGWTDGVNKLYTNLSYDFLYKDPTRNVLFLDNHDVSRFFSVIGENVDKYKSSLSWLLTCRGIPQLYYTSEFATTGNTSPNDGYVRLDFPGGWASDKINKFEASGRTDKDKSIFDHIKALANFRKTSSALTTGKMMQFVPVDGIYVYFRYDAKQTVMVVMNTAKTEKSISIGDYSEMTNGFNRFLNISNGEKGALKDFKLGSYQTVVLELLK